jgi:hypothetical protein
MIFHIRLLFCDSFEQNHTPFEKVYFFFYLSVYFIFFL